VIFHALTLLTFKNQKKLTLTLELGKLLTQTLHTLQKLKMSYSNLSNFLKSLGILKSQGSQL
jgi:predicted deacylase